jgi:acetylornithine aminotransferase
MSDALMNTYGRLPVTLVRGEGARVWDDSGREYLDALAGIAVCGLGHAHPAVAEALADQARRLVHVSNNYHIPTQQELGRRIAERAGQERVFFCNSGAEANETAIKIARRYGHDRGIEAPRIVVCEQAFHGRTLATLTATGNPKAQAGFGPLVEGFDRVPFGDIDAIRTLADERADIVAVMIEPVQGEGGIRPLPKGRLAELRALCDEMGWLLICDEIQSGMGRTGAWFAQQHDGVTADVTTVAKALGNGVPIGACLARGEAGETLVPGSHGTTFGGNPLACRAGLAVLDAIDQGALVERAAVLGERMVSGFRQTLGDLDGVREIRGRGLMIGIELDRECGELMRRALDAGLLINVTAGNTLRLLPPLIITDDEADRIVDGVATIARDFLAEG